MNNLLVIFIFLLLGVAAHRSGRLPANFSKQLNHYVIWICLPAVVLTRVPGLRLEMALVWVVIVAWMTIMLGLLFSYLVTRWLKLNRQQLGCLIMITGFGNTSFFGLPVLITLIGPEAIPIGVFYDQMGSFLSLAILGNIFLAVYAPRAADKAPLAQATKCDTECQHENQAHKQSKLSPRSAVWSIFRKVVTFPPFFTLCVAVLWGNNWLSVSANQLLEIVSHTLTPATMFLVGMHLQFKLSPENRLPLAAALCIKLLLIPLCAGVFLMAAGQSGLIAQVTLLESAMPPMVTASVMAIHAGLAPRLAASAVGYGLFLSILTLPVWRWLSSVWL